MSPADPLRVGLIGHGRIGQVHARNIAAHPRARLVAVHDALPAAAEAAVSAYGATAYATVEELLDAPLDAVVIASPTPTHVDYLERAVLAGLPTLCEKPIDLDLAKVDACGEAIAGHEDRVMLGFHRRFDPTIRAIRDAARAGEIGELESLRIVSRDPAVPPMAYVAESGGQSRDMAIHDLDLARWLLADEPTLVGAVGSVLIDPGFAELHDTDSLHITMRTAAGRLAHLDESRRATYGYDQRLELFGAEGALEMTNPRPLSVERWSAGGTQQRGPLLPGFIERYRDAYRLEMDHFVSAVLDGAPFEVGFDDGRRALVLADAALASLQEARFIEVEP